MSGPATTLPRAGAPAITAALSDVRACHGGWAAACPLCGADLHLCQPSGQWLALCDGYCTSAEVLAHLRAAPSERAAGVRAWLALRLALTPDAWAGLLLGLPVQPAAIDQEELRRLRRAGLWQ
jgi:hypothetical protein